jgi:tetratricopeptide (TPR) repeat protein
VKLSMWLLLPCVWLAACASAPVVPPPPNLFADEKFAPPSERIDSAQVFALSDEMRKFLHEDMAGQLKLRGSTQALAESLYRKSGLKLEYDAAVTRNAAQAFEARAGNCLSLVIMTAAFAKELGLRVTYQSALTDETWSRAENLYLLSSHVNISLEKRLSSLGWDRNATGVVIDFLPQNEIRGLRTQEIGEHTVLAMFMNNRAAEALVRGQVDDAYWWVRGAIGHDARFAGALNTLGVIYKQKGELAQAEHVFNHILAQQPENVLATGNLASTLRSAGRVDEADALAARLAKLEPYPPFYFFNLGRTAMNAGDYAVARDLFAREVRRADYNHEFHFWLAQAYFKLGEVDKARKHLALAKDTSQTRGDRDLYAAKLAWLKTRRTF